MLKKIVVTLGFIMLAVGLLGFFVPNLIYLVQFDLYQSFIYAAVGAVGLKFGFGTSTAKQQVSYLQILAVTNLILLMLGLSWPNLGDIFHLEVPEHFFHALIGVMAALCADIFKKQATTQ